jgi:hypothetical protein
MPRICIFLVLLGIISLSCSLPPAVTGTLLPTSTSTFIPTTSHTSPKLESLHLVESYDVAGTLGISPDDLVYDPSTGHLIVTASGDNVYQQGIFEITLDGKLVRQIPQPDCNGNIFGITRINQGTQEGHFLLVGLGFPTSTVCEYDANWQPVNTFPVTSPHPDGRPGDGIAYNPVSMTILITEEVDGEIFELSVSGEPLRVFSGVFVQGLTYNETTGTFFGLNTTNLLYDISTEGLILQTVDLSLYGIEQAVGIALAEGKLYIADEMEGNSGGTIYIFE